MKIGENSVLATVIILYLTIFYFYFLLRLSILHFLSCHYAPLSTLHSLSLLFTFSILYILFLFSTFSLFSILKLSYKD